MSKSEVTLLRLLAMEKTMEFNIGYVPTLGEPLGEKKDFSELKLENAVLALKHMVAYLNFD